MFTAESALKLRFLFACGGLHAIDVQYGNVAFVILQNFPLQGFINLKVRSFKCGYQFILNFCLKRGHLEKNFLPAAGYGF